MLFAPFGRSFFIATFIESILFLLMGLKTFIDFFIPPELKYSQNSFTLVLFGIRATIYFINSGSMFRFS